MRIAITEGTRVVMIVVKGAERYIWIYEPHQRAAVLRSAGKFASNPELSFTWYDAAVLSQRVQGR